MTMWLTLWRKNGKMEERSGQKYGKKTGSCSLRNCMGKKSQVTGRGVQGTRRTNSIYNRENTATGSAANTATGTATCSCQYLSIAKKTVKHDRRSIAVCGIPGHFADRCPNGAFTQQEGGQSLQHGVRGLANSWTKPNFGYLGCPGNPTGEGSIGANKKPTQYVRIEDRQTPMLVDTGAT